MSKPASELHSLSRAPSKGSKSNLQAALTEPGVISPPKHFALVEPALYRSSLPTSNSFAYIRSLRLKRVVIVSAERPGKSVSKFFDNHRIAVSHTGLLAWPSDSSWKPIAEEVVKESLQLILCADNYPLLVCDVGGVHLVGIVIACLRRLQNWNLNSVVNEYRSFSGVKSRYVNEQFIELFDIDLVAIPSRPPRWFVEQVDMDRREREEYARLIEEKRVDQSGTLVASGAQGFRLYYYSSASPLNSEVGGKKPRIQTL